MFVFLGISEDSWAVGNDHFSVAKDLPSPLQQIWDRLGSACGSVAKAGTMISWVSTAPDGRYALMTKGGELLSNRQDILAAAQPATAVEHIALSPLGGWFIRFTDGTVQISQSSGFSDTFCRLASPYLDLQSPGRQYSRICDVFFSAQEAVIIRTDRELVSGMLSQSLQAALQVLTHGELKDGGYVLSRNTVLCPCNPEQYFLEAQSRTASPKRLYQLPTTRLPDQLMTMAMSSKPPSDDIIDAYLHGPPSTNLIPPPTPPRPHHRPTSSFSALSPTRPASTHRHTVSFAAAPTVNLPWNGNPTQSIPNAQPASIPSSTGAIPAAARERYERLFNTESGGRPCLSSMEAAGVFMQSGLSRADLSRIWEETDGDGNGRFDKEEFVQAMWRIELRTGRAVENSPPQSSMTGTPGHWNASQSQPPQYQLAIPSPVYSSPHIPPPPPYQTHSLGSNPPTQYNQPQPPTSYGIQNIEILVAIICKACGSGLIPKDTAYRSSSQYTTDYFCTSCPHPPTATQVVLIAGDALPRRKRSSVSCDGCWREIKRGQVAWHCGKCWDSKDLCGKCWGKTRRHCKHAASGGVAMMRVGKGGKGGKDDDDWIEDVVEGIATIATGGL